MIGTATHAVFFAAGRPHRIGFPGAIGDHALTLRFSAELAFFAQRLVPSRSV